MRRFLGQVGVSPEFSEIDANLLANQTDYFMEKCGVVGFCNGHSLGKLLSLALDGLTGFTESPLRVMLWSGIIICLGAGLYGFAWLVVYLGGWSNSIPGYPSLLLFILFFGGLNLAALGIIGEYLARIYREVKRRPPYLIYTEVSAVSAPLFRPALPPHSVHTLPG